MAKVRLTLQSFGFKHGIPDVLDMCFDVRFIENPFYVPELRSLTGIDSEVSNFVLGKTEARGFLLHVKQLLEFLIPLYEKDGRAELIVAIGCTGGRHRSPALVEQLKVELSSLSCDIQVVHRDLSRN
jgi:UPF0042 nucleotide-binding protein